MLVSLGMADFWMSRLMGSGFPSRWMRPVKVTPSREMGAPVESSLNVQRWVQGMFCMADQFSVTPRKSIMFDVYHGFFVV